MHLTSDVAILILMGTPYSAHGGRYRKNYGRRHRRWKRTQPSPKPVPLLSPSSFHYDVFLNFRGEDTRKIYVGHLYRALDHKAINTFIDSEELRKGNDLSKLLKAIQESRISIVVFSENYASSTWCLKELVQILKCMDTQNQIVVPIFYQVDPSDVRKLKARFAEAFAKHELDSAGDMEEMESWKSSLTRATNLSGWDSKKYQ